MIKKQIRISELALVLTSLALATLTSSLSSADDSGALTYKSPLGSSQAHVRALPKDYDGNWSASFVTRSLMSQNQNASAWCTEANVGYSITPRFDFGVSEAYTVPMKYQDDAPADFDDLEFYLTAALIDPKLKSPFALSLSAIMDLPTAHSSQLQTEKFGAGVESVATYNAGHLTSLLRGRVVGYAYQNEFGAPTSGPSLPQNNNDPDNFNVFSDEDLANPNITGTTATGTANIAVYQTDALSFVYAVTDQVKIKHQNTIETFAKFDGTQSRLIHEQPGLGYKWSKHFSTWYILDAAKSTEVGGSVFQALRMTHQLAFYFSL